MDDFKEDNLFTPEDLHQFEEDGRSVEDALHQVELIRSGVTFLSVLQPASPQSGVVIIGQEELASYLQLWESYLHSAQADPILFIPASGAASRLFKDLFAFYESEEDVFDEDSPVALFFERIKDFAFFHTLNETCLRNSWKTISKLIGDKNYKVILKNLLTDKGMNYGEKPKGVLLFHQYRNGSRTALEEHLVEAAHYAKNLEGVAKIHFTTSSSHKGYFKNVIDRTIEDYENEYCVRYHIGLSEQNVKTNTLSLTPEGNIFRSSDGKIFFRPAGHGALLENLNMLDEDVIFIKNIDNVQPDALKCQTIISQKLLAGILIAVRSQIYNYVERLSKGVKLSRPELFEMLDFIKHNLTYSITNIDNKSDDDLQKKLLERLDRPLRVVGVIKASNHIGGGPYLVKEVDGIISPQIVEQYEIDMENEEQKVIFLENSYFNPVDMVCSIKDFRGEKYDLNRFVNPKRFFVTTKSKGGQDLRVLEKPGLWNGSMHYWNAIFVEIPKETFTPVKSINDLLNPEHLVTE